ncbi:hypothetical protein L1987_61871 [Smallanthus sonchifolius]|uniref:Uncharacterized protein n=1 Tax=Smallanthus sonchifolius TaxID=185202 RepID=A0ACB9C8S6_9ASTR|nr:hypothetical protein L1987_61871 [Smallanthus sonchifolius]
MVLRMEDQGCGLLHAVKSVEKQEFEVDNITKLDEAFGIKESSASDLNLKEGGDFLHVESELVTRDGVLAVATMPPAGHGYGRGRYSQGEHQHHVTRDGMQVASKGFGRAHVI